MRIKPGGVRAGLDIQQAYIKHLGAGLVATDGVQYSSVATVGTTAVEVLNELIDPGFTMRLQELEVSFSQRFTGVGGTTTGSLFYYWEGREEYIDSASGVPTMKTGSWIPLSATYSKGVASGSNSDDTLEGYVPVGYIAHAPVRVRFTARAITEDPITGSVENISYIRAVGQVIPGS